MKIAIVGAGLIGLSTAYFLEKQGHDLTVFESLSGAGLDTSYGNAGLLTPSLCDPLNRPGMVWEFLRTLLNRHPALEIKANQLAGFLPWGLQFLRHCSDQAFYQNFARNLLLANETLELFKTLAPNLQSHCHRTGTLKICRDAASLQSVKKNRDLVERLNIPVQLLTADETIEKEPALNSIRDKILGSAYYPDDAFGNSHAFTQAPAASLAAKQVSFLYNTPVQLIGNRDRCLVAYADTQVDFDYIVLAAGAYSRDLCKALDLRIALRPMKGYSMTLECGDWDQGPKIPIIDPLARVALTPLDQQIRVTAGAEFAGFDKTINTLKQQQLRKIIQTIYPSSQAFIDEEKTKFWSGLRPMSVDGVPFISKTHYQNLVLNTGHSHLGWTMSLASGKRAAKLVSGESSTDQAYSLSRLYS